MRIEPAQSQPEPVGRTALSSSTGPGQSSGGDEIASWSQSVELLKSKIATPKCKHPLHCALLIWWVCLGGTTDLLRTQVELRPGARCWEAVRGRTTTTIALDVCMNNNNFESCWSKHTPFWGLFWADERGSRIFIGWSHGQRRKQRLNRRRMPEIASWMAYRDNPFWFEMRSWAGC